MDEQITISGPDLAAIEELVYAFRGPSTILSSLNYKFALGISDESVKRITTMSKRVFRADEPR